MIPRDYQAESLDAIDMSLQRGTWSQLLVLPTGGGKTVVFSLLLAKLAAWLDDTPWINRRMLIIAHRDELLAQARNKIIAANPGLSVEIEQGDMHASPMAEVVIASIQTLAARNFARLRELGVERFKVVVVDEAHHAPAEQYQGVLDRLGLLPPRELLPQGKDRLALHAARVRVAQWWQETRPEKLLLGVTATPSRADAVGLEWTFRQVVYEKSLRWMIEHHYLVPPCGFAVETGLNLDTVKVIGGDFQQKGLASIVNSVERNQAIAAAWMDKARQGERMRKTLGFGADVQHAKDLAEAFNAYDVRAVAIDGTATERERYDTLRAFSSGELGSIDALMNCDLFTEGYDEPRISCIVGGRPTKSQTKYSQIIGRGLRLFEGKTDCLVLDAVDNASRHSLVTLGDLFGLPSHFLLNGKSAADAARRLESLADEFPALDMTGARSLDELEARVRSIDLFTPRATGAVVSEYASLQWIADGSDRYHLPMTSRGSSGSDKEIMHVKQGTLGDWVVTLHAPDAAPYTVALCDDAQDAFALGERWIAAHRPDVSALHDKGAAWRTRPPTAKQIMRLQEWGCERIPRTRGEASAMMDAYIENKGMRQSLKK